MDWGSIFCLNQIEFNKKCDGSSARKGNGTQQMGGLLQCALGRLPIIYAKNSVANLQNTASSKKNIIFKLFPFWSTCPPAIPSQFGRPPMIGQLLPHPHHLLLLSAFPTKSQNLANFGPPPAPIPIPYSPRD